MISFVKKKFKGKKNEIYGQNLNFLTFILLRFNHKGNNERKKACHVTKYYNFAPGELAERSIAAVLKTVVP